MAFQGKGIFDGFSGKVGDLVGYKRNGKSIIQSIGKRKGDITRLVWQYVPQVLVDNIGSVSGEFFVTHTGAAVNFTDGAASEKRWLSGDGGVIADNTTANMFAFIGIGNALIDYRFQNLDIGFFFYRNRIRIYSHNTIVYNELGLQTGATAKIEVIDGIAYVSVDNNTGTFVLKWSGVANLSYPVRCIANFATIGATIGNIQFGAEDLSS